MPNRPGHSGGTSAPSGGGGGGLSSGHPASGGHNNNNGNGGTNAGHAQSPSVGNHSAVPQAPAPAVGNAVIAPTPSPAVPNSSIGAPHNNGNGGTTAPSGIGIGPAHALTSSQQSPANTNPNGTGGVAAPGGTPSSTSDSTPHNNGSGGITTSGNSSHGSSTATNGNISIHHGSSISGGTTASSGSVSSGGASSGGSYTVVHGDTMWDIARAHGISLAQLEKLNPQIKDPDLIFPGQHINLGAGGVGDSGNSGGASAPAHATSTSGVTSAAPAHEASGSYSVVHGDTLSGIASSHGMSLAQLEKLNPQIKDPDLIFPGQHINLSGAASTGGTPSGSAAQPTPSAPVVPAAGNSSSSSSGTSITPNNPSSDNTGNNHSPNSLTPNQNDKHNSTGGASPTDNSGNSLNYPLHDPAIMGPPNQLHNQHPHSKLPGNQPLNDPAAKPQGGANTGLTNFPKSSTYPPTGANANSQLSRTERLLNKLKGWGNGTGNTATDPAKNAIMVSTSKDTDPLHIKDSGHNSNTA